MDAPSSDPELASLDRRLERDKGPPEAVIAKLKAAPVFIIIIIKFFTVGVYT